MKSLELLEARQEIARLREENRRLNSRVRALDQLNEIRGPLIYKLNSENVTLKRQLKRRGNKIAQLEGGRR